MGKFEHSGLMTSTKVRVYVDDPWRSDIRLTDIILSLSRQCRFGGHLRPNVEFYSVAQHSVLVSQLCPPEFAWCGLWHDAAEAYVQDLTRPLRRQLSESLYKQLESEWAKRIGRVLGLEDQLASLPGPVHEADQVALATEMRDVYYPDIVHETVGFKAHPTPIWPRLPFGAYRLFRSHAVLLHPGRCGELEIQDQLMAI